MKLSSGGTSIPPLIFLLYSVKGDQLANHLYSITKLMGDSFRLHSQALVGYEDDIEVSDVSTPSMISQGPDDNEDSVY
jgi:hypothetical protein